MDLKRCARVALQSRVPDLAARALGNVGGCQFALHQYSAALDTFLTTIREAKAAGDISAAAVFDVNVASLFSEMGELETATQWMQGALARLNDEDRRAHGPRILIQLASLRAQQRRLDEALRLFAEGIAGADSAGDLELAAIGWNQLGEEYLKQNNLAAAEGPLLQAYRIRTLHHLALDSSYRSLGRLRLEQGDLAASSALLDQAVKLSDGPQGAIPSWDVYHYRGRVRAAQGRLRESLDDLRIAVRLARVWRWSAPPEDAMRIGAEGWLEQVHSALVETGNRLYQLTSDPSLIRETFEAAEENRASSLSALVRSRRTDLRKCFPPEYWEAIARLQRAEVQALRVGCSEETIQAARADLMRMEAAVDPAIGPPPDRLTERARLGLDRRSVLLSFHLGRQVSWLWALDSSGLTLYELPDRDQIAREVDRAAGAIRQDGTDSGELCKTLFGRLPHHLRQKPRWLLALAPGLFEAPFAALLQEDGSRLAESHTIEIIPGAAYWVEAGSRPPGRRSPLFVGIGDPIYNAADPRRPRSRRSSDGHSVTLARLVGSGAELAECAQAWTGDRVLLEGEAASRSNLQTQLVRDPAVVHIATHVVESQEQAAYGLIALSLTPSGENELVPPFEIAAWRTRAGVVVLSGCRSGEGRELPGAGLQGLTRAWLSAGADTVIASHWSTFDSSGVLFGAFYRFLSNHPELGPAAALRSAQLETFHSGGLAGQPALLGRIFCPGGAMKSEGEHNMPETVSEERSWAPLVERIRVGDQSAVEELYRVFAKGIRFFLWRQLGLQDLDDRVHDIFLMVIQSIQRGEVREPERLMGYVRTVVRRQAAGFIQGAVNTRRNHVDIDSSSPLSARELDPERKAIEEQETEVAMRVLRSLPKRDREVLIRFYLQEQLPEQIFQELGITETQFRLIKSRAKSRYGELGKRRFALRSIVPIRPPR